jgi:hypothetical protein
MIVRCLNCGKCYERFNIGDYPQPHDCNDKKQDVNKKDIYVNKSASFV